METSIVSRSQLGAWKHKYENCGIEMVPIVVGSPPQIQRCGNLLRFVWSAD